MTFQFDKILLIKDNAVKMSVFYIAMATVLAVLIFFMTIIYHFNHKERHNRSIFKYSVKLCVFFLVLHNTILAIPFFQITFNMIICQQDTLYSMHATQCYQGASLANCIFGFITIFLFLAELVFFNFFMNEMNPNSKLPSASFNLNQNLLKLFFKMFLCLFAVLDYSLEYREYIVVGAVVILLANLVFFRLNYPPIYNIYVNKLSLFIDAILLYAYLILVVQIVGVCDSSGSIRTPAKIPSESFTSSLAPS
jgi:hypothetical protein